MKNHPRDIAHAKETENDLLDFLHAAGITPKYYVVEPVGGIADVGVQEYFNKPSLDQLSRYLEIQNKNTPDRPLKINEVKGLAEESGLTKEEWFLCKQFANQHPKITSEVLCRADSELQDHLSASHDVNSSIILIASNLVVLGRGKSGRVRLAIVDV